MGRTLLCGAELLDPDLREPAPGALLLEDGRIVAKLAPDAAASVAARRIERPDLAVAPGFLDLHHHGRAIFAGPAELDAALRHDAQEVLRHGTTAFLVTTVSRAASPLAELLAGLAARVADWRSPLPAATPIGIHLEGPWINPEAAGAHSPGEIRPYATREGADLLSRAEGLVRMVTLAPELPGAGELLRELARRGAVAALGHSLATPELVTQSMTQGARHVTHLFNAMGPLHHRAPGLAGAALVEPGLSCDLICDGAHVAPQLLAVAARCKRDALVLITDRLDPPRDATGAWAFPGLRDDGIAFRLADGRLAGSRLDLATALANARRLAGMTRLEAVAACTLRPARVLGVEAERGSFRPGARADLVLLDASDRVVETWLAGEPIHSSDARSG